jgi:hypothetical protein
MRDVKEGFKTQKQISDMDGVYSVLAVSRTCQADSIENGIPDKFFHIPTDVSF